MIEPKIDDLLAAVDSKYSLVILSAKRAREINSYYNQLGEGRGEFVPPLVGDRLQQQAALDRARGDRRGQDRVRAHRGPRRGRSSTRVAGASCWGHRRHRRLQVGAPRAAVDRRRRRGHGRDDRVGDPVRRSRHVRGAHRASGPHVAVGATGRGAARPARARGRPRVVAPATANLLAKLAHGLADDLLTSTLLEYAGPLVIAPAMHTGMWEHPATRGNVRDARGARGTLRRSGRGRAGPRRRAASAGSPSRRPSSPRPSRSLATECRRPDRWRPRRRRDGRADLRADRPGPVHRQPIERQDGRRGGGRGRSARRHVHLMLGPGTVAPPAGAQVDARHHRRADARRPCSATPTTPTRRHGRRGRRLPARSDAATAS